MFQILKVIFSVVFLFGSGALAQDICTHYTKFLQSGINKNALNQALNFYKKNHVKENFKADYILIADYSMNSGNKRFYILNLKTGEVETERVSHGSGKVTLYKPAKTTEAMMYVERLNGEPSHNGEFTQCTIPQETLDRVNKNRVSYNRRRLHNRENLTRPGFFKTAEPYVSASHIKENRPKGRHHWWPITDSGHNGIRLDGLSQGVNHRARQNGVVMHEATYNLKYAGIMGRSYGCPAFEKGVLKKHVGKIKRGRLYYSYVPQCKSDMEVVLKDLGDSSEVCSK